MAVGGVIVVIAALVRMAVPMLMIVSVVVPMIVIVARRLVVMLGHGEFRGRDSGTKHALGADVVSGHGQAAEGAFQVVERQPGVQKRPEHHVAGNARKAVEVENARHAL
jgi:hypothetical protein